MTPEEHRSAGVYQAGPFWIARCTCGLVHSGAPTVERAVDGIMEHVEEARSFTLGSQSAEPSPKSHGE